jgi:hypothetical protein
MKEPEKILGGLYLSTWFNTEGLFVCVKINQYKGIASVSFQYTKTKKPDSVGGFKPIWPQSLTDHFKAMKWAPSYLPSVGIEWVDVELATPSSAKDIINKIDKRNFIIDLFKYE